MSVNISQEMQEWIEAGLAKNWILEPLENKWETIYSRFCSSKIGYFLHLLGYKFGWHTSMIFDPLGSKSFFSALRSWIWNIWHIDIWWSLCGRIDKWRHPEKHRQQMRFMRACLEAGEEECGDPVNGPDWLSVQVLGERYFKRVVELMEDEETHFEGHKE